MPIWLSCFIVNNVSSVLYYVVICQQYSDVWVEMTSNWTLVIEVTGDWQYLFRHYTPLSLPIDLWNKVCLFSNRSLIENKNSRSTDWKWKRREDDNYFSNRIKTETLLVLKSFIHDLIDREKNINIPTMYVNIR